VSYIRKNSDVVVSARMTNMGRQLLSLGMLTFDRFRLGDSEIDYTTLGPTYDITLNNIIRAKAENPDLKTPLKPTPNAVSTFLQVPTLNPVIVQTNIQAPKLGFFTYNTGSTIQYTAYTDTVCHVLQDDAIINLAGITGGTFISVSQAPTYGLNPYEPKVGDLMMVKMSNDELVTTQSKSVVELNTPVPYLWYQVQSLTGSLSANTLQVEIDRDFASFPGYAGSNYCWTTFYPLGSGTGDTQNKLFDEGGYFSGGCVWNMNNVWSYPIPGVNQSTHETFNKYGSENYIGSKEYFGYTSEINYLFTANTACHIVPSISIIHYTNTESCTSQTEQKYGQKFYIDTTIPSTPKLIMPTLMWHKDSGNTIGHVFSGSGSVQYVTLSGSNTTVSYYNLVDNYGNGVGRIFPELEIFTIDDQELVAALSYKANRNWTLPTVLTDLQSSTNGIIDATENLYVTYMFESTSGYTSGLHCQNTVCVNFANENCPPTLKKSVDVQFPTAELPFMEISGGTGWYADKFNILAQRQPLGTYPDPTQWRIMDYTSNIVSHTVGNKINPINMENSTFNINMTTYSAATIYNLNDYITIPQIAQPDYLQFGDERFFFGNIEAIGTTNTYRTQFVFTIPPTMFNTSTNPTWPGSGQRVHINEIMIYDVNGNVVAVGKMNLPIEKVINATIIVQFAFAL